MTFGLSRQRKELAYSLFLIVIIPLSFVGSTIWLTQQVKDNFDLELRRKAQLSNNLIGVQVSNILSASTQSQATPLLQKLIDQSRRQAPELDEVTISIPVKNQFMSVASSNDARIGLEDTSPQTEFAVAKLHSVASLVSGNEGATRQWLVASPVLSNTGTLLGITTTRVSLAEADASINATLRNSYLLLAGIIIGVILLLLNHFKFVEYAELFRKQKELDQLKDDFISIATHELKAPMSVIKGYISMTLEDKLAKQSRNMLTIALEQTDRLQRLVTDLLDVSRLEQGRTKFTISSFDVSTIITPIVGVYQAKAKAKNLELVIDAKTDLPLVKADPDRVQEVFTNLIDNAVKYSVKGTVVVSQSVTPTSVVTTVKDTGIGMTPDEQGHLFGRFYRARNTETESIEGTGLGLWIIRQYIERMGGTITVTSEKGVGSSFAVTLPRETPKV